MNTKIQLLCVQCAYLMMILFGVGVVLFARLLPPPDPNAGVEEIVAMYRASPDMILLGADLLMAASVLYIPFFAAIGYQMRRIEGQQILASAQMLIGVITAVFTVLPALFFAAAAFRPDRNPSDLLLMNDLGYLLLIWLFAPACIQNMVIAAAMLSDKNPQPLFPRWVGFLNIWAGVLYLPGAVVPFFKAGPFAWNGFLGFWVPIVVFFVWMIVMIIYVNKAIRRSDSAFDKPSSGE